MKTGIYEIVNKTNGHRYLGSSKDVDTRLRKHRGYLRKGTHRNKVLQSAWDQYGENSFEFRFIEEAENPKIREQYYLDTCDLQYNISDLATGPSFLSEETKKNISRAKSGANHQYFGKKRPEMSERMKGNTYGCKNAGIKRLDVAKRWEEYRLNKVL